MGHNMGLPPELDRLCRLCLKNAESLEEIFDNNDGSSLVLRIMACVSLEIHEADDLPMKICPPCRYQLEKTYIFRSKCRKNDTRLRRHVKLLAAGKVSIMLEDLDDDEAEFGASLQFISAIDDAKETDRKKELDMRIIAHDGKLRAEWEDRRKLIQQEAVQQYLQERRRNMVDTEVETCDFRSRHEVIPIVRDGRCEFVQIESTQTNNEKDKRKFVSFSEHTEVSSVDGGESQNEFADIEYETIEEEIASQPDDDESDNREINIKSIIQKNIHEKVAKQEEEMLDYLDQEVLMDVDEIEEPEDAASSVTILNEDKRSIHSRRPSTIIQGSSNETSNFVITEVSDSETYLLDEELSQEERKLYDLTDDSDEDDLEAVTNAVKAELAEQPGFNVGENCIMKVEKDRDLTKVEVRAKDGSIICMEFSTEPVKKTPDSLATLRAKMAGEYKCPHCSTICKTPKLLQNHVHSAHPEQNKGHVCDVCAKWCPNKSGLERHYRIHTGEKPFECGECGRGFVQKEILKRHMLVHTKEKPFFCELCPNRYNQKDQLKHHVNMAHSVNPLITIHKCSLCDKEFKYASGLSRHLSSHYGRMYACNCGKSFTDKSALKRHQRDVHGEGKKDKESVTVKVE